MDKTLFCALAGQHRDMIYRIALNFHKNIPDAEDAMQEVLIKLWLYEGGFQSFSHAKHWLIRVTLNQCKNMRRDRSRETAVEELTEAIAFESREESELFADVMALPKDHRIVLLLFYYEELSVRDIARILGLSQTAVTSRLNRARKALKTKLLEETANGI